jgi:Dimerisation domain
MPNPATEVVDLVFGRFRGQILYTGTVLGVFDRLTGDQDVSAPQLASAIGADPSLLCGLLRATAGDRSPHRERKQGLPPHSGRGLASRRSSSLAAGNGW